jgi:hypothetical protein
MLDHAVDGLTQCVNERDRQAARHIALLGHRRRPTGGAGERPCRPGVRFARVWQPSLVADGRRTGASDKNPPPGTDQRHAGEQ